MNLIHLKYAVEVANTGSVNKAAEKLYVGQPNLSRAIKELEASLDIKIFERSSKGMVPTPDGEVFLRYADAILRKVDTLEEMFRKDVAHKTHFSISVPRASYIADAFSRFSNAISDSDTAEVFYQETNSLQAIKNITHENYKLAIIRYPENQDKYYKSLLAEKALDHELVAEFRYVLIMNRKSRLAKLKNVCFSDLQDYIEISHANPTISSLPFIDVKKEELPDNIRRKIFVFERSSQFDLLSENPRTFMWVSPVSEKVLERYDLVQRTCEDNQRIYRDVLVRRKDYRLSKTDKLFISELCSSKREIFDSGTYPDK